MRMGLLKAEQLEKMYHEEYLQAEGIDKFYIRGTLALHLTKGYKYGYVEVKKLLKPEELRGLLGICAARYKEKVDNDTYMNELARFRMRIWGILGNA